MEPDEIDKPFPNMIDDRNQSGGKSEVLTNELKYNTPKESTAMTTPLREARDTYIQITPPIRPVILRKEHNSNEHFDFKQQRDIATANGSSGHLREENRLETDTCFVGLCYSTTGTSPKYPNRGGRAVLLRGMCAQQRPRLIHRDDRVVVYDDIGESDTILLKPVVQCFMKNMEDIVPHELVKIGQ